MPLITPTLFPFAAAYIGMATSSSVLQVIPELRTNGALISDVTPADFIYASRNYQQSGNHVVSVTLSFYSDDILTFNLTRGLNISNTSSTTPVNNLQYSLFLLAPANYPNGNYYFPVLSTARKRDVEYSKGKPTVTQITFSNEDRDVNVILSYQDTLAVVESAMGSKYPL
jgi:hypothetical protein